MSEITDDMEQDARQQWDQAKQTQAALQNLKANRASNKNNKNGKNDKDSKNNKDGKKKNPNDKNSSKGKGSKDAAKNAAEKAQNAAANPQNGANVAQAVKNIVKAGKGSKVAMAVAAAKELLKNPELAGKAFFYIFFFISLPFVLILAFLFASLFCIFNILGNALSFAKENFKDGLAKMGWADLESMTPEEQYQFLGDIIRKQVKDSYNKMLADWDNDIYANSRNETNNKWGIAMSNNGFPAPSEEMSKLPTDIFSVGTGHNKDIHAKHTNWAHDYSYYIEKFPEGPKASDGNYLVGNESFFDSVKSKSSMNDQSNNGAVSNMAALIAGYNVSRCELPIQENPSFWIRVFKNYSWDIKKDTWWTGMLDGVPFLDANYFSYESTLKTVPASDDNAYQRTVKTYTYNEWADVVTQKEFDYTISVNVTEITPGYTNSKFNTNPADIKFSQTTNEQDAIDYYDNKPNGTALTDNLKIKDWKPYLEKNANGLPKATPTSINIGSSGNVSANIIWSGDGNGSGIKHNKEWVKTGTKQSADASYASDNSKWGAVVGNVKYTNHDWVNTTSYTVTLKGTTVANAKANKGDNPVSSNLWGDNPYSVPDSSNWTRTVTAKPESTSNSYDNKTQELTSQRDVVTDHDYKTTTTNSKPDGYDRLDKSYTVLGTTYYRWEKDIKTTYYTISDVTYSYTVQKKEHVWDVEEYMDTGVSFTVSLTQPSYTTGGSDVSNKSFDKSSLVVTTLKYDYYYLEAKSDIFKNSLFLANLFENGGFYDGPLYTYDMPSYLDESGLTVPAEFDIPVKELYPDLTYKDSAGEYYLTDVYLNDAGTDLLEYGIGDWPYYGNVTLFEYTCGSIGTSGTCTADDIYNHIDGEEANGSCGCGAGPLMQEDEPDVGTNMVQREIVCQANAEPTPKKDANGDFILNEDGDKTYTTKTTVKTVEQRIDELTTHIRGILKNADEMEENYSHGALSGNFGDATDLVKYGISIVMGNESPNYGGINPCDPGNNPGGSYSLGRLQWNAGRASQLIKDMYAKDSDTVMSYWKNTTDYSSAPDNPFFMNSNWNHGRTQCTVCQHTTSASYKEQLSELLNTQLGQDIQDRTCVTDMQGYIDHVMSKGVTDTASIIWFCDITNQYGSINSTFQGIIRTAHNAAGAENATLTDYYNAYLNAMPNDLYASRREKTYTTIYADSLAGKVPPDTTSKTGGEGLMYSSSTIDVVYYNQTDERWGAYGCSTVARSGCGPTSMAMVISSLNGTTKTPQDMCDWSYDNGYFAPNANGNGGSSYHTLIKNCALAFGLKCEKGTNPQDIYNALNSGKFVVMLMGPGTFTTGGHFIVLYGVTESGNILVADPASKTRTDNKNGFSINTIWNEGKHTSCTCGNCDCWIIWK